MTIFDILNDILFTKKGNLLQNVDDEAAFNNYMINRWVSMYSPNLAIVINSTTNISIAKDRGGRHTLPSGLPISFISKFFPPGDNPTNGTGSLSGSYTAASESIDLVTGSLFNPYVTSIGLYNDKSELMAIGKLAHPIKNDDELLLNFVVRFDV